MINLFRFFKHTFNFFYLFCCSQNVFKKLNICIFIFNFTNNIFEYIMKVSENPEVLKKVMMEIKEGL